MDRQPLVVAEEVLGTKTPHTSAMESVQAKRKWSDIGGDSGCDHEFGRAKVLKHSWMLWECKHCKLKRKVTFV